jgi:GTP-binding protein
MCPDHTAFNYRNTAFHISASTLAQCPDDSVREVAFVGRSNAGKSSAINTLTRQKSLARTSKTPGRTQLLNFFVVAQHTYLVDLPGFGYAKVPPALKAKWQKELERYLQKRDVLQGLVLLIDIRHPLKEFDLQIIRWAETAQMPLHILLTKADKLKRGAAKTALLTTRKALASHKGELSLQLFSSHTEEGMRELCLKMDNWLGQGEEPGISPVDDQDALRAEEEE